VTVAQIAYNLTVFIQYKSQTTHTSNDMLHVFVQRSNHKFLYND